MKESLLYRFFKYSFIIFILVFITYFIKSGYHVVKVVRHDVPSARKTADSFMRFLAAGEKNRAYNLFYSRAKELGKRDQFKEKIEHAFEDFGNIREVIFLANYPQPDGPYLGMHYKGVHENIWGVDYYFLLYKEDKRYSIFEFIFGEAGTFYPDFSFKKEKKGQPVVIYRKEVSSHQ